jgi:hypothetical protein
MILAHELKVPTLLKKNCLLLQACSSRCNIFMHAVYAISLSAPSFFSLVCNTSSRCMGVHLKKLCFSMYLMYSIDVDGQCMPQSTEFMKGMQDI